MIGPDVPTDDITPRELSYWSLGVTRAMGIRDRHPANFHDVYYREFVGDPMGVVRSIYDRFGMAVDLTTESAMRRWILANPQGKHGLHSYSREAYGVSDAVIEEHFGQYLQRYHLA
jgi:hypothetical protein